MTRRARLRWTAGLLLTGAIAGGAVGVLMWKRGRPSEYRPGEENSGITRHLDRSLPAQAPKPRFTDVTAPAGLAQFRTFAGDRTSQLPEDMGGGAAWGDFDRDGADDLMLVSNGGPLGAPADQLAPSRLYRNRGNGTFERAAGFPDLRITGMGAAWADYDADGWLDLTVTGYNAILLFHNDRGTFTRVASFPSPRGFWTGASWGDYDRDGRLDLYVCGYVRYVPPKPADRTRATEQFGLAVPYTLNPSSYAPERNLLFRNNGNGTFTEVARKLGVDNSDGRSLSALWHDFDQNGWPDIYVANDISESKLFLNDGGKFRDAGQNAWVGEYRGSMGLAAADIDRDGDDDLFISHWIAQQFALYTSLLSDNRRAANGVPDLHFMDGAEMLGIGQPTLRSIGWGAEFADFDHDGWVDLAVAAGSTFESGGLPRRLVPMRSFLFWNQQGRFFHDVAGSAPPLSGEHVSRGLAASDYDNDGDVDLAFIDLDGGVRLVRNDMANGNWAKFRFAGAAGPQPAADGAVLIANAGGAHLRRTLSSASYLSQSSRTLHFGLGKAPRIDSLEVRWPDGSMRTFTNLDANTTWELVQGAPGPRRAGALDRQSVMEFWNKQRAAMNAMKIEGDVPKAIGLFRAALAINPAHEDSLYYLGQCLASQSDAAGGLAQLDELVRVNPNSHRGHLARGLLLARAGDCRRARQSFERAHAINPEETGAVIAAGEVALLERDWPAAERKFEWASRTNPRAAGARFLLGYIAWRRGDRAAAATYLRAARAALGPEWKPKGSVAEGDVRNKMHVEGSLLSEHWEMWDGSPEPDRTFATLATRLRRALRP